MKYKRDKREKEKKNCQGYHIGSLKKKVPVGLFHSGFLVSECVSPNWSMAPAHEGHMLKIERCDEVAYVRN